MTIDFLKRSDGCDVSPKCTKCPLIVCRYEMPGGIAAVLAAEEALKIAQLKASGAGSQELMARFRLTYSQLNERFRLAFSLLKQFPHLRESQALQIEITGYWADFMGVRMLRTQALAIERILHGAFLAHGVTIEALRERGRRKDIVSIRTQVIYQVWVETKLPKVQIGLIFNRDHTTVIYAIKQIEKSAA